MKNTNPAAQSLRLAANALLQEADNLDQQMAYAVVHKHRFGETAYTLRFDKEPTEQVISECDALNFEPEKDSVSVFRMFTHELCGLASPGYGAYPILPGRLPGLLDDRLNPDPAPVVSLTCNTASGAPQALATLHQGNLVNEVFIALLHAVGLVYQLAALEAGHSAVQATAMHPVQEVAACC